MNTLIQHIIQYWHQGKHPLLFLYILSIMIFYFLIKNTSKLKMLINHLTTLLNIIDNQQEYKQNLHKISPTLPSELKNIKTTLHNIISSNIKLKGIKESFNLTKNQQNILIKKDLIILKALITAAPLLGLLGTVFGMIQTFHILSINNLHTTKNLSQGISHALITTQFGLIIALPGIFGTSLLKRKLKIFNNQIDNLKYHLLLNLRNGKSSI